MKTSTLTILLTICYLNCFAQCKTNQAIEFFNYNTVNNLYLEIDSTDYNQFVSMSLKPNQLVFGQLKVENQGKKESYCGISFHINDQVEDSNYKKSIKINFGQHTDQLKGIYLEAINNDPTLSRKKLMNKLLVDLDIPTPRMSHTNLYINNQFIGLYLLTEPIDERFLHHQFDTNDGVLYNAHFGADLMNDPNSYLDDKVYHLYSGHDFHNNSLHSFLDSINLLHHTEFKAYIEKHFDTETFIKTLAVEILCGHWNNYAYNKNNFSLYQHPKTKKWTYIPKGYNNTFGINYVSNRIDWAVRDVNHWLDPYEARLLVSKILEDPDYRNQFNIFIHQYIKTTFNTKVLSPYLNHQKEILLPYVENDYLYCMEYGWTETDFILSFEHQTNNHIDHGLKEFIDVRSRSALKQVILPTENDLSSHWIKTIQYLPEPDKNVVWMTMNDMNYKRCMVTVVNDKGKTVKRFIYSPAASIKVEYDKFSKGTYFLNTEIENIKGSWVNLPNVLVTN
ncbi:CotH kinase family protein [Flammeovirga yaeyamensis]|uniref:CotH kinase family protein n=1 Tax=Flammeovirga yaeyamensis TaxID=367791 RepID=A0AAX1N0Q2_9BACT|nr:CotH kinase family protein [Flammeovirga yaeyamensis]MBB3698516.1 hypothetical protein [Flammeovirga yaeyamensis]NMF34135.1 hypothetical protein [Flammeovirga yaeyamensis]QWG01120.1 CotH kinase family protein [Flammeovirga yaeyamensis]